MNEISDLINVLTKLPGFGKKNATRLSYFIMNNKNIGGEIARTIEKTIKNVKFCNVCGNYTTEDICEICKDTRRDNSIICVVEEAKDMLAIEETGSYRGLYHILMGAINPLDGKNPDKLKFKELEARLSSNNLTEVLIATNPTIDGDSTFLFLLGILSKYPIKVSRIATGIPAGGSLEYSDQTTLSKAIIGKVYVKNL
ncbi:MAG TPA: recombination mediator RecR [Spirochaetota bacterium]|nr:recombination mediator RecR [Spirochaetota bacterium]